MVRTFAAIDVGSFEFELGIYELSVQKGVKQIDRVRHLIALGKDTYNQGKVSYQLVDEMCRVLGEFAEIMKGYQVESYRAYATSAMREAKNSQIILDQVRVRTGIEIRIISNSEQRFLSYKAIAAKDTEFQKTIQKGTAIADVGYGSMQLSLFDKDSLVSTQNLAIGALRLREILAQIKGTPKQLRNLSEELIDNELITYRKMYLKDRQIKNLIGIGDAFGTLYSKLRQEKEWITVEQFGAFYEKLKNMTIDQLEEEFDIGREHASVLLPTATIYKQILQITGAELMWMPEIRLIDGVAAEYAEMQKVLKFNHNFNQDIIITSRNIAKRYKCHMAHTQVVENIALQIFDSLKKYHGLKERERLLLQIAANLHSCGKFITMKRGSECAYNIIMGTEIIGLSHLEREIVANMVHYNLNKFSYNEVRIDSKPSKHTKLVAVDNLTMVIAKLTAILRVANSLDRGHRAKLENSKMAVRDGKLVITTDYDGDITLERLSVAQKEEFFEEIFGIRLELKQRKKV